MGSESTSGAQIRDAKSTDTGEIERLWAMLVEHQQALEPRLRFASDAIDRWRADISQWLRSDYKRVWVAEEEAGLIGFLSAERSHAQAMFAPRIEVLVSEIFVEESHRGRGIGGHLLVRAREWADQIGASGLTANVLAANQAGRQFWMNAGGKPFFETTVIEIDSAPAIDEVSVRGIGFGNL